MAVFGLPGGSELVIIFVVILLVFAPVLAWFGFGYMLGRRETGRKGGTYVSPDAPPIEPAPAPGALPKEAVQDSPHPDDADVERPAARPRDDGGPSADAEHADQEGPDSDA